jgi:lysozyme
MARIGDTINPGLGKTNFNAYLAGAQQGAAAMGRGIASMGASIAEGVKQQQQVAKDTTSAGTMFKSIADAYGEDSEIGRSALAMYAKVTDQDRPLRDRHADAMGGLKTMDFLMQKGAQDFRQNMAMENLGLAKRDAARADRAENYRVQELNRARDREIGANKALEGMLPFFVQQFEGFSATPYDDYGQTSIGYGTRAIPGETSISKEEGERRLAEELATHRARVDAAAEQYGYQWTEDQRDALTSFDYNTGSLGKLIAGGSRSDAEIAEKMRLYNKAGGKTLRGLTRRRNQESELFTKGYAHMIEGLNPDQRSGFNQRFVQLLEASSKLRGGTKLKREQIATEDAEGNPITETWLVDQETGQQIAMVATQKKGTLRPSEDEQRRTRNEEFSFEENNALIKSGPEVAGAVAQAESTLKLLDEGVKTGWGKGTVNGLKAAAQTWTGIDMGAANFEQVKVGLGEHLMAQMQRMTGVLSDNDIRMLAELSPGVKKTTEGNKQILRYYIQAMEKKKRLSLTAMKLRTEGVPETKIYQIVHQLAMGEDTLSGGASSKPPAPADGGNYWDRLKQGLPEN